MHPAMKDLEERRAADRREHERREGERRLLQAEADTRRMVREQAQRAERRATRPVALASPYGNSSSYAPATDMCSAAFVPAAESYSPPPSNDSAPSGGGGSFDGGGASGDY